MVSNGLILLSAVAVLCHLTQAERQCDGDDGSFTLSEQILLFPISLLDRNKCVQELNDVADNTHFDWYFGTMSEFVHGVLATFSQTVVDASVYIWATMNGVNAVVEEWIHITVIPACERLIEAWYPADYLSHYLTYVWNLDPTASVVHVLTMYSMSLLPTCVPINQQLANILPTDITETMVSTVRMLLEEILNNPSWAVRVLTATLLMLSLIIRQYRNGKTNPQREQFHQLKKVSEHHLMCEIFDNDPCNCGGKQGDSSTDREIPLHYRMCESYDKLPCNCGGTINELLEDVQHDVCPVTEKFNTDIILSTSTETDVDVLSNSVDISTGINDCSGVEFVSTIQQRNLDSSPQGVHFSPNIVYHDFNTDDVTKDKISTSQQDNSQSKEFNDLISEHYQMCECFDALPCNCGGRCDVDEGNSSVTSGQCMSATQPQQELHDNSLSKPVIESENGSPNSVYFDYDICISPTTTPGHWENITDGSIVHSDITDDADNGLFECGEDISESSIGAPVDNSSFREESHYVTMDRDVSPDELFGGGDGVSTLTRRSPYVEQGFEDLVTDESYVDAETSLLDISSINNSLSFTEGDGVFEFAVMVVAQTAWRLIYNTWKKKFSSKNVYGITAQETSPGLYLVRQRNKLKRYLTTSQYRNNSADDEGYHGDQEQDDSGISQHTGIYSHIEIRKVKTHDDNNNANEKQGTDALNIVNNEHTERTHNLQDNNVMAEIEKLGNLGQFEDQYPDLKLFKKAQTLNCNVWELSDDEKLYYVDDKSHLLAWAWSKMED